VSELTQDVVIDVDLDVPDKEVSSEELDLIEANFSPLIRQMLVEFASIDK
jgi:hypothetical protein